MREGGEIGLCRGAETIPMCDRPVKQWQYFINIINLIYSLLIRLLFCDIFVGSLGWIWIGFVEVDCQPDDCI